MEPRLQEEIDRQEKEGKEAAEKAQVKHVRRCYVDTFTSSPGRVVLADLRREFYDVTTYIPGDPYGTHVGEGQRAVILRLLTILSEEADGPKEAQESAET